MDSAKAACIAAIGCLGTCTSFIVSCRGVVAPLLGFVTREKKLSSAGSKMMGRLSSSSEEELRVLSFEAIVSCRSGTINLVGGTTGALSRLLGLHRSKAGAVTGDCLLGQLLAWARVFGEWVVVSRE